MRVQGEIVIRRPVDAVFDYVADERNEPKYNPRMTSAQMVSPEPIGVGSRFRAVMIGAGRAEMSIEYTSFDRPRRLGSAAHLAEMDIEGALTFEPVHEGTLMHWVWDLRPHGFWKVLGPVARQIGQRQELRTWTGLKRVLEAQAGPPSAAPPDDADD